MIISKHCFWLKVVAKELTKWNLVFAISLLDIIKSLKFLFLSPNNHVGVMGDRHNNFKVLLKPRYCKNKIPCLWNVKPEITYNFFSMLGNSVNLLFALSLLSVHGYLLTMNVQTLYQTVLFPKLWVETKVQKTSSQLLKILVFCLAFPNEKCKWSQQKHQ